MECTLSQHRFRGKWGRFRYFFICYNSIIFYIYILMLMKDVIVLLALYRCTVLVYRCTVLVYRCTVLVYRCTVQVYRCTVLVYRCTVLVYRCTVLVYRCTVLVYKGPIIFFHFQFSSSRRKLDNIWHQCRNFYHWFADNLTLQSDSIMFF